MAPPFTRAQNYTISSEAPKPNGNYSHAIRQGNHLHVCGWMGDDPKTGNIVEGGVRAQTEQAIRNIDACLRAAGSSLDKVTRRRIFVIDMAEFREIDAEWARRVAAPFPVNTCVGVTALAKDGARVEIEVEAVVDEDEGA
ncbi:Endoribonuclease L-PSP/chorismate mutase-like protein [Hypoxylon sp. FL1284]|nr:Endoribonuclease L-PSP/chorismate mutase-like protein [Hypoxylon sp. FL1284]